VNTTVSKSLGVLTGWLGDGPWRSKTVLAALAAVVIGTGFWFLDVKNSPPQSESGGAVVDAPTFAPTDSTAAPAETHWDWKKPFPWYAKICASYVAGFCIGWFFRKLIRLVLIIAALTIALLVFGKYAGCDTTRTQEQVTRGSEWAQRETTAMKDSLKQLLPSATAGGVGTILGFRRRGKTDDPKQASS
jgi:uncharacterized membrane protein (Fun14 family)